MSSPARLARSLGLLFLALGFVVALAEGVFVATRYRLAFQGPFDAGLYVAFQATTAGLMAGFLGLAWGALCGGVLRDTRGAVPVALIPVWLTMSGAAALYLGSLGIGFSGSPGLLPAATILVAAALACAPLAVVLRRTRERPPTWRALGLSGAVLLAVAVGAPLAATRAGPTPRPGPVADAGQAPAAGAPRLPRDTNVLLILVDTLRADHLGTSEYSRATSPFVDQLAGTGVRFAQTIAQATRTSPNMASLMTGLTPYGHGIIRSNSILDESLVTWGEILDEAGYRNVAMITNPNVGHRFRFTQGMHLVEELFDDDRLDITDLVPRAEQWLRESRSEPFFMWLHTIDPHRPYDPPARYTELFEGDETYADAPRQDLPVTDSSSVGGLAPTAQVDGLTDLRDYVARYDAEIRFSEEHLLRVWQTLDELGLLERTLVIFTSDHGESLGEHDYFFAHGTFAFDATARVPLILSHPALPSGLVIPELVRTIDVLPTVLELLGLPVPSAMEGRSLVSLIDGKDSAPRIAPICAGTGGYVTLAARSESLKLVLTPYIWGRVDRLAEIRLRRWPNRLPRTAYRYRAYRSDLYDLVADPGETAPVEGRGVERGELEDRIRGWIDGAKRQVEAARPAEDELDEEMLRRLRSLGYIE